MTIAIRVITVMAEMDSAAITEAAHTHGPKLDLILRALQSVFQRSGLGQLTRAELAMRWYTEVDVGTTLADMNFDDIIDFVECCTTIGYFTVSRNAANEPTYAPNLAFVELAEKGVEQANADRLDQLAQGACIIA